MKLKEELTTAPEKFIIQQLQMNNAREIYEENKAMRHGKEEQKTKDAKQPPGKPEPLSANLIWLYWRLFELEQLYDIICEKIRKLDELTDERRGNYYAFEPEEVRLPSGQRQIFEGVSHKKSAHKRYLGKKIDGLKALIEDFLSFEQDATGTTSTPMAAAPATPPTSEMIHLTKAEAYLLSYSSIAKKVFRWQILLLKKALTDAHAKLEKENLTYNRECEGYNVQRSIFLEFLSRKRDYLPGGKTSATEAAWQLQQLIVAVLKLVSQVPAFTKQFAIFQQTMSADDSDVAAMTSGVAELKQQATQLEHKIESIAGKESLSNPLERGYTKAPPPPHVEIINLLMQSTNRAVATDPIDQKQDPALYLPHKSAEFLDKRREYFFKKLLSEALCVMGSLEREKQKWPAHWVEIKPFQALAKEAMQVLIDDLEDCMDDSWIEAIKQAPIIICDARIIRLEGIWEIAQQEAPLLLKYLLLPVWKNAIRAVYSLRTVASILTPSTASAANAPSASQELSRTAPSLAGTVSPATAAVKMGLIPAPPAQLQQPTTQVQPASSGTTTNTHF